MLKFSYNNWDPLCILSEMLPALRLLTPPTIWNSAPGIPQKAAYVVSSLGFGREPQCMWHTCAVQNTEYRIVGLIQDGWCASAIMYQFAIDPCHPSRHPSQCELYKISVMVHMSEYMLFFLTTWNALIWLCNYMRFTTGPLDRRLFSHLIQIAFSDRECWKSRPLFSALNGGTSASSAKCLPSLQGNSSWHIRMCQKMHLFTCTGYFCLFSCITVTTRAGNHASDSQEMRRMRAACQRQFLLRITAMGNTLLYNRQLYVIKSTCFRELHPIAFKPRWSSRKRFRAHSDVVHYCATRVPNKRPPCEPNTQHSDVKCSDLKAQVYKPVGSNIEPRQAVF